MRLISPAFTILRDKRTELMSLPRRRGTTALIAGRYAVARSMPKAGRILRKSISESVDEMKAAI